MKKVRLICKFDDSRTGDTFPAYTLFDVEDDNVESVYIVVRDRDNILHLINRNCLEVIEWQE